MNVPQICNLQWNDEERGLKFVPMANHAYGHEAKYVDYALMNICSIHVRIIYEVSKLHKKVALGLCAARMKVYYHCTSPRPTHEQYGGGIYLNW